MAELAVQLLAPIDLSNFKYVLGGFNLFIGDVLRVVELVEFGLQSRPCFVEPIGRRGSADGDRARMDLRVIAKSYRIEVPAIDQGLLEVRIGLGQNEGEHIGRKGGCRIGLHPRAVPRELNRDGSDLAENRDPARGLQRRMLRDGPLLVRVGAPLPIAEEIVGHLEDFAWIDVPADNERAVVRNVISMLNHAHLLARGAENDFTVPDRVLSAVVSAPKFPVQLAPEVKAGVRFVAVELTQHDRAFAAQFFLGE